MFQIKRLYTEPATIDPIDFHAGLNIVMGESDPTSSKNNGVGKSLCIEFIDFALLKQKSHSRASRIPKESFPHETMVCLDFEINGVSYTIKRSIADSEHPVIITGGIPVAFSKLEDATSFLTEKLFDRAPLAHPSFREILGPLIRDEKSEFKSIVACYDTTRNIPDNYTPHLYLLGIEAELYGAVKDCIAQIDETGKDIKRIEENVRLLRQKEIEEARSDLNDLDNEVATIKASIDRLENTAGFDLVKDDIIKIEEQMGDLRRQKAVLKHTLLKLKPISEKVQISSKEIREFYDQMKAGLGELISKEYEEVLGFKQKIEGFQNHLLGERRSTIIAELAVIEDHLHLLDKKYTENLKVLDQEGSLKNLKQTYAAYQAKYDELGQLRGFLNKYEELLIRKQKLKSDKESKLLDLQASISAARDTIHSFEQTVLETHDFIQGNRKASFDIKQTSKKQVVEIIMRIDDDGSHSIDRAKVFIYDFALLINAKTKERHPGLLIHDNIFEVDQDTLANSLKFILERTRLTAAQQYILTLNSDRLESFKEESWHERLAEYIRASFTKKKRFLKTSYQETK